MMTAFQRITKSTTEHLGAAQFNRPPRTAKRHGFSPPFTVVRIRNRRQRDGNQLASIVVGIRPRLPHLIGFGDRASEIIVSSLDKRFVGFAGIEDRLDGLAFVVVCERRFLLKIPSQLRQP